MVQQINGDRGQRCLILADEFLEFTHLASPEVFLSTAAYFRDSDKDVVHFLRC